MLKTGNGGTASTRQFSPANRKEGPGERRAEAAKRTPRHPSLGAPHMGRGGNHQAPRRLICHPSDREVSLTFHGVLLYRPARFRKGDAEREKKRRTVSEGTKDRAPKGVMERGSKPPQARTQVTQSGRPCGDETETKLFPESEPHTQGHTVQGDMSLELHFRKLRPRTGS